MKFCPNCANLLTESFKDNQKVKMCHNCGYIDWNNWVNVSCVVVAYTKQNEFVMVRLKRRNKITFPGGFRNLGESLEDGAKREFFEETGMSVYNLEIFKVYTKDDDRLVWIVFKGKIDNVLFVENDETSEIILVKDSSDIKNEEFRGPLTQSLFNDLINIKKQSKL